MKLNAGAFGGAAGLAAAALFTLCAAFVAVAPGTATGVFGYVLHLDLTTLARPLTVGSFVGGLLFWAIGSALAFAAAARIYNALVGRSAIQAS